MIFFTFDQNKNNSQMTQKNIQRHRRINLGILIFLIACCVFFTFWDLLYEKIWWSVVSIYIPCAAVFGFGMYVWNGFKSKGLYAFGIILMLVDIFLVGYGVLLCIQGEWLWGPLTLGFSALTIPMTWSAFKGSRESMSH